MTLTCDKGMYLCLRAIFSMSVTKCIRRLRLHGRLHGNDAGTRQPGELHVCVCVVCV